MADIGQDEIDKFLSEALGGGPAGEPKQASAPAASQGPQSQDDIDALLAGMSGGDEPAATPPAPAPEKDGPQGQDDIDALLAGMTGGAEPTESEPVPAPEKDGPQGQDDIDALLAGMTGSDEPAKPEPASAPEKDGPQGQGDIDALLNDMTMVDDKAEKFVATATPEKPASQDDIDALLSGIGGDEEKAAPAPTPAPSPKAKSGVAKTPAPEELFGEMAAEPPAQDKPRATVAPLPVENQNFASAVTAQLSLSDGAPAQPKSAPAPSPAPTPEPPRVATRRMAPIQPADLELPPLADTQSIRESLSLLKSAGEVEGLAGEIAGLLGQLSERARRFQNAWLSSDQEAKELRTNYARLEHKADVLESEKKTLHGEVEELRARLSRSEGEKLAGAESSRTEINALELKLREQQSRSGMLDAEVEALKGELTKARNESTGSDLESRRARFELDRIRSELDAERMERMRLQRALDNREKELQAVQSQTSGQASSLFLDELHRLVRRLENELDIRTSAAHEALAQLDRLKTPDEMAAVVSNLRAAVITSAGLNAGDSEDTLRSLTRDSLRPGAAVDPVKPDDGKASLAAFEAALSALDVDKSHDLGYQLIRETYTTPSHLMSKIYVCPSLRKPEAAGKIAQIVRLLKMLRQTQEAADRARGREGPETERMLVQMFDYLHNMVRLKLVTRTMGEAWQLFLDLRGRYSQCTSDKQWSEYRDRVLGGQ